MDIFPKNSSKPISGYTIGAMLGKSGTEGDIGIEIEMEGNNLPHDPEFSNNRIWEHVVDHSLRGNDNGEYVLRKPIKFDNVDKALENLWKVFAFTGATFDESNRTSVHVHLNCQEFYLNRFASFCALYICFEEVLTEWCGEYRVGNLFCLRSKDAPGIITKIKSFIKSNGESKIGEHLHYAGFNIHALTKFGSIEVRTMRGVSDPLVIRDWVRILRTIYDKSADFPDPRGICDAFSFNGPLDFFYSIMGDQANTLRNGIDFNDERLKDSMYEGIRLAQDICYCADWDEFTQKKISPDPFGRPLNRVLKKLNSYEDFASYTQVDSLASYAAVYGTPAQPVALTSSSSGYYLTPIHQEMEIDSDAPDF